MEEDEWEWRSGVWRERRGEEMEEGEEEEVEGEAVGFMRLATANDEEAGEMEAEKGWR